jgi:DNA-binding CsgD family transcriptional regulator
VTAILGSAPRAADARVEALPAAAVLLRRVTASPALPLRAVVVGPGGTGKTTLLDAVGRAYAAAGIEAVRWTPGDTAPEPDPGAALLVDDAHRLDGPALDSLGAFVGHPEARLVVAHRPWPRPPGLAPLTADGRRLVVVVGHLGRDAVAARVSERVGVAPPAALVDLVHEQSGGLPALVDIVAQAMCDTGRFDARRPDAFRRPDVVTVSVALAERLRHHVDALPPDVRGLLEAMAVGAALDSEVLGPLLQVPADVLSATVEAARATGLLTEAGELIPFVRSLFLRLVPVLRRRELQRGLAGIELDRGGSVLAAGRQLLGTGATGSRVAAVLSAAADEALAGSPALAADLLRDAVHAGAPPREVAGRRARALALAGDLDEALRVGDPVVADPHAPGREDATLAAAAVLAGRGLLARSAELYRGLSAGAAVLAVPALVADGAADEARAVLAGAPGTGTLLDGAAALMARGMLATVSATASTALSQLARAAALLEPVAPTVLLPDTPAALTAVVALQSGELSVAHDALRRALEQRHGGRPALVRHRLLHGWVLLSRGRPDLARRVLAALPDALEPRDELVAAALGVALARRADDPAALAAAWPRARDALVRHPVDLTVLAPLGELVVATAQLGEEDRLAAHLAEADALLDRLGRPALWSVPLDWYRFQAADTAGRGDEAVARAAALSAPREPATPYAAVLAAYVRCREELLAGRVDAEAVVALARRMQGTGLGWEAAQLAARAAAATDDRRVAAGLQAAARALSAVGTGEADSAVPRPRAEDTAEGAAEPRRPAGPPAPADQAGLTERELEIGRHILAGLTYRQIGERLFLSAKTVEHHVARMRQRLGVNSRDELFGLLRTAVDPEQSG